MFDFVIRSLILNRHADIKMDKIQVTEIEIYILKWRPRKTDLTYIS